MRCIIILIILLLITLITLIIPIILIIPIVMIVWLTAWNDTSREGMLINGKLNGLIV